MRHKCRWTAIALGFAAIGAVVGALFLFADQSAGARRARLEATTIEIRRGNYFAWGQVWMWLDKLSLEEKNSLLDACAQYARTNRSLYVTGCSWPPQQCSVGMQPLADWMRNVAGYRTTALMYDQLSTPATSETQVEKFEHMFFSRRQVAP